MVGLLGLTQSEAKHKKKHKKKGGGSPPVSPPPPQCPASCPVCQACTNGLACTPTSHDDICEDNPCKTCQGGACVSVADAVACGSEHMSLSGMCTACTPPGVSCSVTPGSAPCCSGTCTFDPDLFINRCQKATGPCSHDLRAGIFPGPPLFASCRGPLLILNRIPPGSADPLHVDGQAPIKGLRCGSEFGFLVAIGEFPGRAALSVGGTACRCRHAPFRPTGRRCSCTRRCSRPRSGPRGRRCQLACSRTRPVDTGRRNRAPLPSRGLAPRSS
jgi:hypothetical protein